MMQIPGDVYPAILKVITDSELILSGITGYKISLKIEIVGNKMFNKDDNKSILQNLVCEEFGISWSQMRNGKRLTWMTDARKAYSFLAEKFLGQTLVETGKDLGRHHTSIINLRDGYINLADVNDPIKIKVENIKTKLHEYLS